MTGASSTPVVSTATGAVRGETGTAADWGLQDQAALPRWVRVRAAAFGGDPDDITLAGTSAGGASAHRLASRADRSRFWDRVSA